MPFEVEKTIIKPPGFNFSVKHRLAMKSINLMCFLMKTVTFRQLYLENLEPTLKLIIEQAKKLDDAENDALLNTGAYNKNVKIKKFLVEVGNGPGALDKCLAEVKDKHVVLGDLFSRPSMKDSPQEKIAKHLNQAYSDSFEISQTSCELDHFCCPFLYFQHKGNALLDPQELSNFLTALGSKTMESFYTEKKVDYITNGHGGVISRAKEMKILVDRSPRIPAALMFATDPPVFEMFPPANGLKCEGGICVEGDTSEDFCSSIEGYCSAASSP